MKQRVNKNLYKEFVYIPKHEKLPDKVFKFRMIISLLAILVFVSVMMASTFALFYSEVTTDFSTIEGAYYSLSISNTENYAYICQPVPDDKHIFEIKAYGTATTGYCKVKVGDDVFYTDQIIQGGSSVLTIYAAQGTVITFEPHWGYSSNFINGSTCGNEIFHSTTRSTVYTVEPTAKLSSIAAHYGVTEESILIYNNLLAATVGVEDLAPILTVGMELKIPNPAENVEPYTVPYSVYTVEPTATLEAISEHYGVSIEDILAFNDMSTYGVGMSLKIPNADPDLPDYAVPYATYIVEPTATISDIAAYYNISETDILTYNNISEISLKMFLNIPGVEEDFIPYAVPFATYTVEENATIEGISEYYGISVFDIATYNGFIDMTVGNIIKIPGVSPDTPSYVAPIPEIPSSTDESVADNILPSISDDIVSDNDIGDGDIPVGDTTVQEPINEELAVFYPIAEDYILVSGSTIKLSLADILIYKGHKYETVEGYQKELDLRITGIEAVSNVENEQGEFFCKLLTKAEKLSLCLEITENIEEGYLKIIIGESEYYTVQIKRNAYIRLDIVAPIGTEITFEAYEGVSHASINEYNLYGDNIKDDSDGNNALLDHIWMMSLIDDPVEPDVENNEQKTDDNAAADGETIPTDPPTDGTTSGDSTSDENTPTEGNPEENTPTEGTPEENIPTEGTPEGDTTTEGAPEENTPIEGTPECDTPTEGTPEDDTPAEGIPEVEIIE